MAQQNLSPAEAAKLLGVDAAKILELKDQGVISGSKTSGDWKLSSEDVQAAAVHLNLPMPSFDSSENSASADLLADELALTDDGSNEMRTVVGGGDTLDEGNDEVRIDLPNEEGSSIGGSILDELDDFGSTTSGNEGDMQTLVGSSPTGASDPINIAGDSGINAMGSGLLDELNNIGASNSNENEMQTLVGNSQESLEDPINIAGDSSINSSLDAGIMDELDGIGGPVDANEGEMQTLVGSSSEFDESDQINLEADSSINSFSGGVMDELDNIGSNDTEQTLVGQQGNLGESNEIFLDTADESAIHLGEGEFKGNPSDSTAQTTISKMGVDLSRGPLDDDIHASGSHEESDVRMVPTGMTTPDSDIRLHPIDPNDSIIGMPAEDLQDPALTPSAASLESDSVDLMDVDPLSNVDDSEMSISLDLDPQGDLAVPAATGGSSLSAGNDEATIDLAPLGDSGIGVLGDAGTSDIMLGEADLGDDSGIALSADTSDIMLDEAGGSSLLASSGGMSQVRLSADEEEEDEFVLGGSEGSDITLQADESGIGIGAGESGIALAGLSASGLSLDENLDLSSSSISVNSAAGSSNPFMLTPTLEEEDEDSQDSGSQVIALDQDSSIDESAATMLGPDQEDGLVGAPLTGIGNTMLGPDPMMHAGQATMTGQLVSNPNMSQPMMGAPSNPQMSMAGGMQMPAQQQVVYATDIPYSVWNIVSLCFCMLILIFCGILMVDLIANIWHWDSLSTSPIHNTEKIMDSILDLIEKPPQ